MASDRLPSAAANVIHQKLADGAVLFLPSEEIYFGLNEVGSIIWGLLPPANEQLTGLLDELCRRFPEVDRAILEADTRELLSDLHQNKLVAYAAGDHASAGNGR